MQCFRHCSNKAAPDTFLQLHKQLNMIHLAQSWQAWPASHFRWQYVSSVLVIDHTAYGSDCKKQPRMAMRGATFSAKLTALTWSMSTGQMRLFSLLYFWHSVAPFSSASFTRPSMKLALLSLITGVMAQSSCKHHKWVLPATLPHSPMPMCNASWLARRSHKKQPSPVTLQVSQYC